MSAFKPKAQKSPIDLQTNPSGRGVGVPAMGANMPRRRIGGLPRQPFHQGDGGSPSSSMDVQASQMMQNVSGPDDIEWWAEIDTDPPYEVWRDYIQDALEMPMTTTEKLLREYIRECVKHSVLSAFEYELMREDEDLLNKDDDEEADVEEMSVSANVAGYTAPLGYTPSVPCAKKKRKEPWAATAAAFGGAKKM